MSLYPQDVEPLKRAVRDFETARRLSTEMVVLSAAQKVSDEAQLD